MLDVKTAERKIYLVRHGQASLGAADYDNLSPLGEQQAARLGRYFASRSISFDAVYGGTLKRHAQTYAGIRSGMALAQPLPGMALRPGLNEYDAEAVIRAICPPEPLAPMQSPKTSEGYKQHFALLRRGIASWMKGESQPVGMTTYAEFAAGVREVLDEVRASTAQSVLIASSGGPLSSAVAQVLGLSHEAGIELNMRMRNTAVSELLITPKRCVLLTFNTLPHLDYPSSDTLLDRVAQTYA